MDRPALTGGRLARQGTAPNRHGSAGTANDKPLRRRISAAAPPDVSVRQSLRNDGVDDSSSFAARRATSFFVKEMDGRST